MSLPARNHSQSLGRTHPSLPEPRRCAGSSPGCDQQLPERPVGGRIHQDMRSSPGSTGGSGRSCASRGAERGQRSLCSAGAGTASNPPKQGKGTPGTATEIPTGSSALVSPPRDEAKIGAKERLRPKPFSGKGGAASLLPPGGMEPGLGSSGSTCLTFSCAWHRGGVR